MCIILILTNFGSLPCRRVVVWKWHPSSFCPSSIWKTTTIRWAVDMRNIPASRRLQLKSSGRRRPIIRAVTRRLVWLIRRNRVFTLPKSTPFSVPSETIYSDPPSASRSPSLTCLQVQAPSCCRTDWNVDNYSSFLFKFVLKRTETSTNIIRSSTSFFVMSCTPSPFPFVTCAAKRSLSPD